MLLVHYRYPCACTLDRAPNKESNGTLLTYPSSPGSFRGGGKRAWYALYVHALNKKHEFLWVRIADDVGESSGRQRLRRGRVYYLARTTCKRKWQAFGTVCARLQYLLSSQRLFLVLLQQSNAFLPESKTSSVL